MKDNLWKNLSKPIIGMAPMDGVTDAPFRHIIAKYGKPDVVFTEFTSVEGICHDALKPLQAFLFEKNEKPIIAQLFGSTPCDFYKVFFVVAELGFDGIDINMGCPAKSVVNKGGGANLIKTPALANQIIRAVKKARDDWKEGTDYREIGLPEKIKHYLGLHRKKLQKRHYLPVSIKTRTGYAKADIDGWIGNIVNEKPDAICVHGRTFKQLYEGVADWDLIAQAAAIAHQSHCVILGNGDIKSREEAINKANQYGVDGVLIGRAALGNPWAFTNTDCPPEKRLQTAVEHSKYFEKTFGKKHFVPMRKHLGWYCKGFPGASEMRQKLMTTQSAADVYSIIKKSNT